MSIMAAKGEQPQVVMGRDTARVIWMLLLAAFVTVLNETTMGVALVPIAADLGVATTDAQWLTTVFMLTMAVVIPVMGRIVQRFTTRGLYLVAMSLFTLGTALASLSPIFGILVAARVVQAVGTAMLIPLLMTLLVTVVPFGMRGRIMARLSIVMSLAPAMGPSLSGLVLETLGWRWIFAVMLPVAISALGIGWFLMTDIGARTAARIDALSVVLAAGAFGGIVYGLSRLSETAAASSFQGGEPPWFGLLVLGAAAVVLGLFVWRQLALQRQDAALLDLATLRSARFALALAVMTVLSAVHFGMLTLLPLYLSESLGVSPFSSGLMLLPGAIAIGVVGPFAGRVFDRWGGSILLGLAAIIACAVLWTFALCSAVAPIWFVVLLQTLLATAMAMSFTPLFTAGVSFLPPGLRPHGSAMMSTVQQLGGAAGVALLVAASAAPALGGAAHGMQGGFIAAAVLALSLPLGALALRRVVPLVPPPERRVGSPARRMVVGQTNSDMQHVDRPRRQLGVLDAHRQEPI